MLSHLLISWCQLGTTNACIPMKVFLRGYKIMKLSALILPANISLLFFAAPLQAVAADRGHYAPQSIDKSGLQQRLPDGWRSELSKGKVLNYDVYKQGKVVYRDASQGTVALRLENKVIRLVESTREIVDILHPF